jgi:hypothetical protein
VSRSAKDKGCAGQLLFNEPHRVDRGRELEVRGTTQLPTCQRRGCGEAWTRRAATRCLGRIRQANAGGGMRPRDGKPWDPTTRTAPTRQPKALDLGRGRGRLSHAHERFTLRRDGGRKARGSRDYWPPCCIAIKASSCDRRDLGPMSWIHHTPRNYQTLPAGATMCLAHSIL